MTLVTQDIIDQVHEALEAKCDTWDNGIYKQPYGVDHVKGYCVYQRWETGGADGGNYNGGVAQPYTTDEEPKAFYALDALLLVLCPDISFMHYKALLGYVKDNSYTDSWDYYGNHSDYAIRYIEVSVIEDQLIKWGYDLSAVKQ